MTKERLAELREWLRIESKWKYAVLGGDDRANKYRASKFTDLLAVLDDYEKGYAAWFDRGKDAAQRNNKSGCCCKFDENDDIVSLCAAHEELIGEMKAELERARLLPGIKDDTVFIDHIQNHLAPGQEVVCKICGKTARDIIRAALDYRAKMEGRGK